MQRTVSEDTGKVIPGDMMLRLTVDRYGNRFKALYAIWRKLRAYTLIPGACSSPNQATTFHKALSGAIREAFESTSRKHRNAVRKV
ncbi:hypothetical protein PI125_g2940 [Phytophthora idaei]|nr:hypothetical protein PI125_g2940 [Phytophthora idaei]